MTRTSMRISSVDLGTKQRRHPRVTMAARASWTSTSRPLSPYSFRSPPASILIAESTPPALIGSNPKIDMRRSIAACASVLRDQVLHYVEPYGENDDVSGVDRFCNRGGRGQVTELLGELIRRFAGCQNDSLATCDQSTGDGSPDVASTDDGGGHCRFLLSISAGYGVVQRWVQTAILSTR
jgi:hypothetical protein